MDRHDEKDLLQQNYRKYCGKDVDVYFNVKKCAHVAYCTKGLPSVFNLNQKPWIQVDASDVESVIAQVKKCPSGALQYIRK